MELSISGIEITVPVTNAIYEDYAAARCDALQLQLYDETKEMRQLDLKKGDIVTASEETLSTGEMYISDISYNGDDVQIRALSLKTECFGEKSFYRERLSFLEMVKEIEEETGCTADLVNQLSHSYIEIVRERQNPIAYLASRLRLEGYQLKINNNRLIIYDERIQEKKDTVEDYMESDFISFPVYSTKDAHLIESITNTYKGSQEYAIRTYVESGMKGKRLETSIAVESISESERFSRGLMREANKYEFLTYGHVDGLERRTGQSVNIDCDLSDFSGKNYIYKIKHDLINTTQRLYMRKQIKGDY